ncbi:response regulator [Vibrio sp. WXL103]|uniref:ATP-binding response regulator n=1 Tax=unclassified Vibrio TaxID=2614977 RepID=UPI003EC70D9B
MAKIQKPLLTLSIYRISIGLFVAIAVLVGMMFYKWQQITPIDSVASNELVIASKTLNETLSSVTLALQDCFVVEDCMFAEISQQLLTIQQSLDDLIKGASLDKSSLSLVGAIEYTNLQLALARYLRSADSEYIATRALYDALVTAGVHFEQNHSALTQALLAMELNEKDQYYHRLMWLIAAALALGVLAVNLLYLRLKKVRHGSQDISSGYQHLAKQIENMDTTALRAQLNDTALNVHLRQIYSTLKQILEGSERQKQVNDLYKQLYALIGYEIRSITTTINGGIQYLVQETDDSGVAMARDITSAANTLSELADNYNRLISKGGDTEQKDFALPNVLSELVIHLHSKTSREQTRLECYIDNGIPNRVQGQSTQLFWILFLQLSSALQVQNSQHILVKATSGASSSVEKTKLTISVYFLTTSNVTLSKLDTLHWSRHTNPPTSNEELARTLLNDDSHFSIQWLQSGNQVCFQLQIDLSVKSYLSDETKLDNRQLLVLSNSQLQVDILQTTLEPTGATITAIDSPNELFKLAGKFKDYDAIILTDTLDSKKLPSFSKTVKAQLKAAPETKLFLSVSSAQMAQETLSYVDKIFYLPFIGFEFTPALLTALETESTEDNAQNSSFLIVEDDRVQQILLKRILTSQEYEPDVVNDGTDAVEHYKQQRTDIIFMDCIMPGMNGMEATKLIRIHEQEQDLMPCTIIGATALTSSQEHQACIEAGMDFVISKPYKSDEIVKVINKYVAVQKLY